MNLPCKPAITTTSVVWEPMWFCKYNYTQSRFEVPLASKTKQPVLSQAGFQTKVEKHNEEVKTTQSRGRAPFLEALLYQYYPSCVLRDDGVHSKNNPRNSAAQVPVNLRPELDA